MNDFNKYNEEVKTKWCKTSAYKESEEKTKNYSTEKWNNLTEKMNDILREFSVMMKNNKMVNSIEVQNLVLSLQNHITENYYHCTDEILAGLGVMYTKDERFKNNIDKHALGTSEFISEAIKVYCGKNN